MDCEEIRVDMRKMSEEELAKGTRMMQQIFRLNHTMPMTPEYTDALKNLFGNRLGEGSHVAAPIAGAALDKVKIGRNVYVNTNALMMARGGITIEDDVQIAANVQLISNNHDEYDRQIPDMSSGIDQRRSVDRCRSYHSARGLRRKARDRWCNVRCDEGRARLCSSCRKSGKSGEGAGSGRVQRRRT